MGRTKLAQERILEFLRRSPSSKKDLKKVVKAKDPSLKKHVKKALEKLMEAGQIMRDGKTLQITKVEKSTEKPFSSIDDDKALPIAVRLRKEQTSSAVKSVKFVEEDVDLDDEIRRLEMELNKSSSSDDESDLESTEYRDNDDPGVISLSAYAQHRIDHLPAACLPEPGKYNPRGPADAGRKRGSSKKQADPKKTDGLKEAVQEVLNGYKARSSERLPFYCRFCSKQYSNEQEFFEHKSTEFHKTAVEMERKATYCRLCLKQLTSPEQMKEHLTSRPHKERLQTVRNRQRADAKGGKRKRGQSERQWT